MYGKNKSVLTEWKAERPNPYTGNVPSADDIERASQGQKFADGGMSKKKGAVMAIVAKLGKKPMGGEMEMDEEGGEDMEMMQQAKNGDIYDLKMSVN